MEKEYKITIEELTQAQDSKYPNKKEIFTLTIGKIIDIKKVIEAVYNSEDEDKHM